jgi:CDP-6-deoxy-D-xylo-4-hexulose-3-dehydrase
LGLGQIKKLKQIIDIRNKNYNLYQSLIKNDYWKSPDSSKDKYISNFAYPIIHPRKKEAVEELTKNRVETRPLICGSLGKQPFWTKTFGEKSFKNADIVNDHGFYLPNNHEITKDEIHFVSEIVNECIG